MSGSGISWAICKSASRSSQITMPVPHHSSFYRPDALPATQPTASKHWRQSITEGNNIKQEEKSKGKTKQRKRRKGRKGRKEGGIKLELDDKLIRECLHQGTHALMHRNGWTGWNIMLLVVHRISNEGIYESTMVTKTTSSSSFGCRFRLLVVGFYIKNTSSRLYASTVNCSDFHILQLDLVIFANLQITGWFLKFMALPCHSEIKQRMPMKLAISEADVLWYCKLQRAWNI